MTEQEMLEAVKMKNKFATVGIDENSINILIMPNKSKTYNVIAQYLPDDSQRMAELARTYGVAG